MIWPKLVNFDAFILIACCAAGSIARLSSTPRLVVEEFAVLLGGILTFGTSWREPGTGDGADAPPSPPSTAPGDAQGAALALPRSSVLCSPVSYKTGYDLPWLHIAVFLYFSLPQNLAVPAPGSQGAAIPSSSQRPLTPLSAALLSLLRARLNNCSSSSLSLWVVLSQPLIVLSLLFFELPLVC